MDRDQNQPERRPVLLFAFANDERPGRRLGGLCREIEDIRRTLAQLERDGACEVVVRESTTPAELVEVLEDPRYRRRLTTLHFAGHASGTRLLLEGEGEPVAARIEGLATLLGELESLALVVLNGCGTLTQGERLVQAGIPAVIATEHAVEDAQAQRFAADFYRSMAGGASITEAFDRAFAQAQCFAVSPGVARDLALTATDEEIPAPWRLLLADPHGDAKDWSLSKAVDDPLFGLPAPVGAVLPQEPFMGLRRFTARESAVLFGRGRAIRNLYGDVTDPELPPLVVVYGASGVGKSSLLEAGLLPRLAHGHEVHDLRLERGEDPESLLRQALHDADHHGDLATAWRAEERARGRPVVICIDQLEVLVLEEDGAKALARFIQALKPLGGSERPRGKLLLGLRKEWFPELRNELKRQSLEWHDHFVEPLGREDIEEVVLGPTRTASLRARYGITCEDGLARRIADDLSRDRRSAIAPVLQILLTRMWERAEPQLTSLSGRVRRRFTLEAYDELRRDGLALSDFVSRQLAVLRGSHSHALDSGLVLDLLFRHTTPRGTAASSTYAELRESYDHQWPVVEGLVERCISLYLLQGFANAQGIDVGVRLAHDTLAPIVRDRYRHSKAPGQAAARLLEARMGMSEGSGRSRLLDEHDLAQVEAAQTGMRRWTEEEARLVAESRARRTWSIWLRRGRIAVVVVSLGVAIVAWAVQRMNPEIVVDPPRTSVGVVDMAQESSRTRPEPDGPTEEPPEPGTSTMDADATPADRGAAPAARTTCSLRSIPTGLEGTTAKIGAMAITADGRRVAVGMAERQKAFVLEPLEPSMSLESIGTAQGIHHLAWSPDGGRLAIGEKSGGVQLVSWSLQQEIRECERHESIIEALAFSADGASLLTADFDGRLIAWNGRTCEPIDEHQLPASIYALRERDGAGWLVAGSRGMLATWDGPGTRPSPLSRHGAPLWDVELMAPGGGMITVGQRLRGWSRAGTQIFDERLSPAGKWVFVGENGELVITAGERGVQLWRIEHDVPKQLDAWKHETITDVAVYPDLLDVLVVSSEGTIRWLQRDGEKLVELRPLALEAEGGGAIVLDPRSYLAVGDHAGRVMVVTLPENREQARSCTLNDVP